MFATGNKTDEVSEILYPSQIDWAVGFRELQRMKSRKSLEFLWSTEPLEKRVFPEYLEKDPAGFFKQLTSHKADAENFLKGRLRVRVSG